MEEFKIAKKEESSKIEFDPEISGVGVIATKPLDHSYEIEFFLDELFSCESDTEKEEFWISKLMNRKMKGQEQNRERYLKIMRDGEVILKLKNLNEEKQNLFWKSQYDKHLSEHFYEDLINSVKGDFVVYFVFYKNISQAEVDDLFKFLKGRTPYYTEVEGNRLYNTEGFGIRGLYPRPSTTIQKEICEKILKKNWDEELLLYYNLEPEEQKLVYPYLNEMERFRILSNTVHTPNSLEATISFINMLYHENFENNFLIEKLIDLNKKFINENR